jgi:hypothetical protein
MNKCVSFRRYRSAVVRYAAFVLVASTAIPLPADPVPAGTASTPDQGASVPAAQADFERLLEERDFGTFKIYGRLSAKSRAEVFQSYSQGTSIEQVKDAVMKAFLHK